MPKKVAVITDATSAGYFFPVWHRYYSDLFGSDALHVLAYKAMGASFDGFPLGSVVEVEGVYSDQVRAPAISNLVANLLEKNDVVIRCDVDEFLKPAPSVSPSLSDYIETLDAPYVTAIGLDLVEMQTDPMLDLSRDILQQRPWCIETSSLSKTAIVTSGCKAIRWAEGFHAASVMPAFRGLYLLHAKFADIKGRVEWFISMRDRLVSGSETYAYYDDGRAKVEGYGKWLNAKPKKPDLDVMIHKGFRDHFLSTVEKNPINGIFQGSFLTGEILLKHGIDHL